MYTASILRSFFNCNEHLEEDDSYETKALNTSYQVAYVIDQYERKWHQI